MRNKNGVEVREICAACNRRLMKSDGRYCSLDGSEVDSGHSCSNWKLNELLQGAGNSGGKIKSSDYLRYFRERWIGQRDDLEAGRIEADSLLTTEQIREEYEEQFGSIYISF